jgi:hypothetical protein
MYVVVFWFITPCSLAGVIKFRRNLLPPALELFLPRRWRHYGSSKLWYQAIRLHGTWCHNLEDHNMKIIHTIDAGLNLFSERDWPSPNIAN